MAPVRGSLVQVKPAGPTVGFTMNPESVILSGGAGGWQAYQRPKRIDALEWAGQPTERLTFTLWLDGWEAGASVEGDIAVLEEMARPKGLEPPPQVKLQYGPIGGDDRTWVVENLEFGEELRGEGLERLRAEVTVTLLRYEEPGLAFIPVEQHKKRKGAGGSTTTVAAGETLVTIAVRELGSAARWTEIAALNGLRDPSSVTVGTRIQLPKV